MKPPRGLATVFALAFFGSLASAAQQPAPAKASHPTAAPTALPAPILAAFKAAYPQATLKHAAQEKENGRVVWEIESVEGGLGRDLLYTPDGSLLEIEEEVPSAQLPAPVTAAVKATYPSARVVKGEKVTRGATVFYELQLAGAAKKSIELTPDGKLVSGAADGTYRPLKEIAIGGEGGWDYLSVDSAGRRLYVSHATKVVVIDLDKDVVVGEIAPAPGVHGIAIAPQLGRAFVSNGREATVSIVDLKTLQITGTVKTGENPDAVLYEPVHQEVYAFNGRSKSATVFDAKTGELRATVPLPGKPEFAVFDEKAGRIYNNIEDTSQLVAIDPAAHAVVATWPIAPGEEASGLALDAEGHRLFVGCSNERMLMVDAANGKLLASVPIGPGVDANAYDPGTGLAFASSGDGTLTVARPEGKDKLTVVQTLTTPKRSRTMTLDPKTHRLYVAAAEFGPAPTGPDGRPQRPPVVAGSFKVVVYEMTSPPGH